MTTRFLRRQALLCAALLATAGAAHAAPQAAAITITGFAFSPARLVVPVGASVTWTNGDDIPHTVTSAATPRLFGSDALDTGERFTRIFDKPGTYRYYCAIHPHMQGVVVVR